MNVWFTSDTHWGHSNIIRFCKRPFASVEEMDEVMIQRWNARVKPNDIIWHLGDFAFHKTKSELETLFNRLNGVKCLVIGNHDHVDTRKLPWADVKSLTTINVQGRYDVARAPVILCHYAMRVWDRSHHGTVHLYGHSHGALPGDSQSLDVGVDCWDYSPVNIDEVHERLKTLKKRPKEF